MAFVINKTLDWIAKSLGRSIKPGAGDSLPSFVTDGINGTINVLGWERYQEEEVEERSAGAPAIEIESLPVPQGEAWYVFNGDTSHTDTGVSLYLMLNKIIPRQTTVEMGLPCDAKLVLPAERVVLLRPVLLQAGDFLRARTAVALTVGVITLRFSFIRINPGEYIPPL